MHLTPQEIAEVKQILRTRLPGVEVRAFGSRVAGKPRKTSDLDLALMTAEPLDFGTLGELRDAFTESDLPFRVDLVDWATTDSSFRRIIERRYETL